MTERPEDVEWKGVGARIRTLREAKGLTGQGLGDLVGVLRSEVSRVEGGAVVKEQTLAKYAAALGVSVVALRYGQLEGADIESVRRMGFDAGRRAGIESAQQAVASLLLGSDSSRAAMNRRGREQSEDL